MKIDPNAPAYPLQEHGDMQSHSGMTIRAEIASRIMAGFAANPNGAMSTIDADYAVKMADALIAELNK